MRPLAEARARWEINHRLAIEHEAAHAAAAVLLGLRVSQVRVDWPDDRCQGRSWFTAGALSGASSRCGDGRDLV